MMRPGTAAHPGDSLFRTECSQMTNSSTQKPFRHPAFSLYPEIEVQYAEFENFRPELLPSKLCEERILELLDQLLHGRYENFKRLLSILELQRNRDSLGRQFRTLLRHSGIRHSIGVVAGMISGPGHDFPTRRDALLFNALAHLMWRYVETNDREDRLATLTEPLEGNPPRVMRNERLISFDLARAVNEYDAVFRAPLDQTSVHTILEIGPGYGRTAYVFLELQRNCRYILVDIPPALYIAERYLSNVFAERKIFGFRSFSDFESVRSEFYDADILFLTPNQLESLPPGSADLTICVSSFQEMRMDQIGYYFSEIDRLTSRFFYFREKREARLPDDNELIRESDYPVAESWELLHRRTCKAQPDLFEALYVLPDATAHKPVTPTSPEVT